jgi:hypothetical protein
VQIYDAAGGVWVGAASMMRARARHSATRLSDGRVLVAGGFEPHPTTSTAVLSSSAEVYNPATNTWTATPLMPVARGFHTATLLLDGRVLLVGGTTSGTGGSAVVYNPASNSWSSIITMPSRTSHTATLLADGRVLVAGGITGSVVTASAVLFDPATNAFTPGAPLPEPRRDHAAVLLSDGSDPRALITGGFSLPETGGEDSRTALIYQPDSGGGTWSAAPPMGTARTAHAATLIANGRVLVTGGHDLNLFPSELTSAELFVGGPGANRAPVANAGPAQTVKAGSSCAATVTLDGTASMDPDGDQLTFTWTGPFGTATGPQPSVSLPIGIHTITLVVNDGRGGSATATVVVTALDGAPPVITAPPPIVVTEGEPVTLPTATATDCGPGVVITSDAPQSYPLGTTTVTFTATDAAGNVATAKTTVTVVAGTPYAGRMSGQGHSDPTTSVQYYFAFDVSQGYGSHTGRLHVYVRTQRRGPDRHDHFVATGITGITFRDDPTVTPGGGATADTVKFRGTGVWNCERGYTFEVLAKDAGEPGRRRDTFTLTIWSSRGRVVASVDGHIASGNVEAGAVKRARDTGRDPRFFNGR